ncbi:tannase/feruloyl esterase family alpha/beta hydrolase [Streptomyces mirabilis]|uniref:tannase/feruloyl esterase family alpha/beta hydrolase n=1 Tax=Streptomyces mirabilis TaxID=68239 RepID=UPI00333334C7
MKEARHQQAHQPLGSRAHHIGKRRAVSRLSGIALAAASLTFLAQPPSLAAPHSATDAPNPACVDVAPSLLTAHMVESATSTLIPATVQRPAYCQVDLVPERAIKIRVALPLNATDGGMRGELTGAWNGRVLNMGGGGYAGSLSDLSFALQRGEVGSTTDTGHNTAWCNAVNSRTGLSNAQPDCGLAGGGFVLDPRGKLLSSQVKDFINRSLYDQTIWALKLTKAYYGESARRNYWVGGSTGGRQGWEMAQQHGDLYDGFLLGYPAMNWNRFIIGEAWPAVVVNELLGPQGLAPAKSDAANAAAVAACDSQDGTTDRVVAEPRRCHFDARKVSGLTAQEARAVNLIWDGPRDARGDRLWGGITRGTSFSTLLPGGSAMSPMIETYVRYWLEQNDDYDWRTHLTIENFPQAFEASYRKFERTAATDSTDLSAVRRHNGKILYYLGTNDPLIVPFGSYNYQQRLFDRYGVEDTRTFVRTFYFPNVGHSAPDLTGTAPPLSQLLDSLQAWTERGKAPESFDQWDAAAGVERTICAYPDTAIAAGSDAPCPTRTSVPDDLVAASLTAKDRR